MTDIAHFPRPGQNYPYEVTMMKIKLELTNQSKNPSVGFGDQAEQQRGSHQAHTPSNCFF